MKFLIIGGGALALSMLITWVFVAFARLVILLWKGKDHESL